MSDSVAVLALDPGGTTGVSFILVSAAALSDPRTKVLRSIQLWDQWELNSHENQQITDITTIMRQRPEAAIVTEDFQLRTMAAELSPVRITAAVDWWLSHEMPHRPLFRQMPSLGKRITDDRLQRWGYYKNDKRVHARDATRHALMFLRRAKKNDKLRQEAWPGIFK